MAPARRNKDSLLARVNFPLYTLQMLTSRHILVAGGGGSAKTGVANGFVGTPLTYFMPHITFCFSFARKYLKYHMMEIVLLPKKLFVMKRGPAL